MRDTVIAVSATVSCLYYCKHFWRHGLTNHHADHLGVATGINPGINPLLHPLLDCGFKRSLDRLRRQGMGFFMDWCSINPSGHMDGHALDECFVLKSKKRMQVYGFIPGFIPVATPRWSTWWLVRPCLSSCDSFRRWGWNAHREWWWQWKDPAMQRTTLKSGYLSGCKTLPAYLSGQG